MMNDNQAVSETLGYILLFAIALTAIAIILLVGNTIINNEKSSDNFQNMVQNFAIIQSDLTRVALEKTPIMTTMIHMDGGTLSANATTGYIKVDYGGTNYYENDTGQILFSNSNDNLNTISLSNGGVWEKNGDVYSDTLVTGPRIYVTPLTSNTNTLVLNIIKLNTQPEADAGTGTLNIGMKYNNTSVITDSQVDGTATLTIETQYPNALNRYMTSTFGTNVGTPVVNGDNVTYTVSHVSQLIISEHTVNVDFSGIYV